MASVTYDKCIMANIIMAKVLMAKVLWQMKLSPLHYKNRSIVEVLFPFLSILSI